MIVLFEDSPIECKKFEDVYIHHFKAVSNTGVKINLLQEFYFISLDIFRKALHNKGITGELDAWLTFLCEDNPEYIEMLIRDYPKFKLLYEDVYRLCMNVEDVMGLFSEELRMLDRNTTQFMIDTMQEKVDAQQAMLDEQQEKIGEQQEKIDEQQKEIQRLEEEIARLKAVRDLV